MKLVRFSTHGISIYLAPDKVSLIEAVVTNIKNIHASTITMENCIEESKALLRDMEARLKDKAPELINEE